MKKTYKERRIFYFSCLGCKRERAQSFKKRVANVRVCRKCRIRVFNPDQMAMFPPIGEVDPAYEGPIT